MTQAGSRADAGVAPLDRVLFDLDPGLTYLNHAATGVFPRATRDALQRFVAAQTARGVLGTAPYEARMPELRETVGRFIGARGSDIAFLRSTSDGANVVARGLDWKPGDEIIVSDNEFGSNVLPFLALRELGVVVRFVATQRERMTPAVLRRMLTARTRLVAVSWVSFGDGYRHDLAALSEVAHAGGALFCVDAIQALGAFGLDVEALEIDALYCGAQKWLLGLQGSSFLYLRPSLLERMTVRWPGWRSLANMWEFLDYEQPPADGVARFEAGTPNFIGALSIATSIGVLAAAGVDRISAHVLALTGDLIEGLRARGARVLGIHEPGTRSGIVTFRIEGHDPVALGRALGDAGIVTTFRPNGIRVAPHGHNTADDIERLLSALPR